MMKENESKEYTVLEFFPLLTENMAPKVENLLDKVECPPDKRGFRVVYGLLDELAKSFPIQFKKVFGIEVSDFIYFSDVNDKCWDTYSNVTPGRGWKSQRPIYSLLFEIARSDWKSSKQPILLFIDHYFSHEIKIKNEGRQEPSMRAFRLLFSDPKFDDSCLSFSSADKVADSLEVYKNDLKDSKNQLYKTIIKYCFDLMHFYRLDWKARRTFKRNGSRVIRGKYTRAKIERVVGTDDLFTLGLGKQRTKKFEVDNGIDNVEDLPALAVVEQEPISESKPEHEKPDVSIIKDSDKRRAHARLVTNDVQRAHNITVLHRTVLQPHELTYLWKAITSQRKVRINKVSSRNVQSAILLMLFFGLDLEAIRELKKIQSEDSDGFGIYNKNDAWYLKVKHSATAVGGKHSLNEALLKTKGYSCIVIPKFISKYLQLDNISIDKLVLLLPGRTILLKAVQQFLSSVNKKYHIQLSYKSVQYFLSNWLLAGGKYDSVVLEYLTGKVTYYTRSKRHYIWYSDSQINEVVYAIWRQIFDEISLVDPTMSFPKMATPNNDLFTDAFGTGSQFTPTTTAISEKTRVLRNNLNLSSAFEIAKSLSATIKYHNAYTVYTLYMLINASGYRAVYNPLPHFNLNLARYGAMCISDKDERKSFSHMRIIAIPTILQEQLQNYLEHINAMGNLLGGLMQYESSNMYRNLANNPLLNTSNKTDKLEWFLNAKHSRSNDGTFVILNGDALSSKNIGPKLLTDLTKDSGILPINFGRHYLRKYLQNSGVSQELINFQLGHWVTGELPLGSKSSFEHIDAVLELSPYLNSMMEELGWEPIPSLLTRKRR